MQQVFARRRRLCGHRRGVDGTNLADQPRTSLRGHAEECVGGRVMALVLPVADDLIQEREMPDLGGRGEDDGLCFFSRRVAKRIRRSPRRGRSRSRIVAWRNWYCRSVAGHVVPND